MIIDSAATKVHENRIHIFDPIGLINHGIRPRQAAIQSYDAGTTPLIFAVKASGVDSDASSPRLWKTSPASTSPLPEPMSPTSRTEAIARGQIELMEMIKDLPESFYELSLRDIVEQKSQICHPLADHDFTEADDEKQVPLMAADWVEKLEKKKKKKVIKRTMSRSRSVENGGYLLKTSIFPISFRLRRKNKEKKKNSLNSNGSVKVGPIPASMAPAKISEKEWWRRKSSDESDSSGGLSSSNSESSSQSSSSRSSSTSSRQGHSKRFLPGCCSFRSEK